MAISRRGFIGTGVGAVSVLGLSLFKTSPLSGLVFADEPEPVAEVPIIWLATGSCTGCSVSLLNADAPTIQESLLGEILPGKHLSLAFHTTVMAAAGELAMSVMHEVAAANKGAYVLVVDGATARASDGLYCAIGERRDKPIPAYELVRDLSRDAAAVLAIGTCAAFGGIPAAEPNPTAACTVRSILAEEKIRTPLVNIPGCPPQPDWIIGSIATLLLGGADDLRLDEHYRPALYFTHLVHDHCPYRGDFDRGRFAEHFGDHGCLFMLGCKGAITHSDCPTRRFNNRANWCCEAGHPCVGCTHPQFPFDQSLFRMAFDHGLTGKPLDSMHEGQSCSDCHKDNRFGRLPRCDSCHIPDDGVMSPRVRPGPTS